MDNRSWIWVGAFGGVASMLVVWLLLDGSETRTGAAVERAQQADELEAPEFKVAKGPPKLRPVQAKIDPSKLTPRHVTRRPNLPITAVPDKLKLQQPVVVADGALFPLDSSGIAAAVEARHEDLVGCYETALFHTPDLEGSLVLTLVVEPDDEQEASVVSSVKTSSDLDATILEGCIATVFEELRFEKGEQTTINYPVDLRPAE